jgi:EF hand
MACSHRAIALVAAGGLFSIAPALAQEIGTSAVHIQKNAAAVAAMMDGNRDGRISKGEFFRHNADPGRFVELDTDADGELNEEEQKAANVGPRSVR